MEAKPRVKIDLKTALAVLAFLGVGTFGSLWGFSQRLAFFLLASSFKQQSEADSIRTERMISQSQATFADTLTHHLNARCDRIENYITRIPAVQKAFTDAEKARLREERIRLDRSRLFPSQ